MTSITNIQPLKMSLQEQHEFVSLCFYSSPKCLIESLLTAGCFATELQHASEAVSLVGVCVWQVEQLCQHLQSCCLTI